MRAETLKMTASAKSSAERSKQVVLCRSEELLKPREGTRLAVYHRPVPPSKVASLSALVIFSVSVGVADVAAASPLPVSADAVDG
jgi:hypothetical protein